MWLSGTCRFPPLFQVDFSGDILVLDRPEPKHLANAFSGPDNACPEHIRSTAGTVKNFKSYSQSFTKVLKLSPRYWLLKFNTGKLIHEFSMCITISAKAHLGTYLTVFSSKTLLSSMNNFYIKTVKTDCETLRRTPVWLPEWFTLLWWLF